MSKNSVTLHPDQGAQRLRRLVTAVCLGIAGCIVVIPVTYLQSGAGAIHVYLVSATLGLWALACVLPMLVARTPGASLIACLAMGVGCAVATPFGASAIPALLLEGLVVELPFAVLLYRRYTIPQFVVASVLLGLLLGWPPPSAVGVVDPSVGVHLISAIIAVVCALVFLALGVAVERKLVATGVVQRGESARHV